MNQICDEEPGVGACGRSTFETARERSTLTTNDLSENIMQRYVDLNDVRTFVIAAQAGTLSAAAKMLHQPPSTVSRSLTRLERYLGVLLAHRGSKGLIVTDAGSEYLLACRRALRTLTDGEEFLEAHRTDPSGTIKIACPLTMAREILAPLLKDFITRFPSLKMEIEPYSFGWDQEPREDVDVFFKLKAPKDSIRRVRSYPGTARGLFASPAYVNALGSPANPDELATHRCAGSGVWKLSRGSKEVSPHIAFHVVTSDPGINLSFALHGLGITVLPLWLANHPDHRNRLIPILPLWKPEPITLCALFSGSSRLTPKVEGLLDFLAEYIGTERDPRVKYGRAKQYFTDLTRPPTSGP